MIHQFILAAPKPGMTAQEFQDYWVNVHAVRYASKIPQIRKYMVDTVVDVEGNLGAPALPHQGIAEIFLANGEEQLASLQTEEFLQGARLDEPNWAAFWQTIVIDTTAHEIVPGPPPARGRAWVKLTVLQKRRPGLALDDYRKQTLDSYAPVVKGTPDCGATCTPTPWTAPTSSARRPSTASSSCGSTTRPPWRRRCARPGSPSR